MAKIEEILVPIAIIILAVIFFPEEVTKLFENKMYFVVGGIILVLFLFFIWLKSRTNY